MNSVEARHDSKASLNIGSKAPDWFARQPPS
jgi:hypothetical protein